MSLSGQYLEELSRRYKKQVEDLQQALTQQTKMVRMLEEQSRLHHSMDELNMQRNAELKLELNELTMQFHACLAVIVCAGVFLVLMLFSGMLLYRSLRRQTRELLGQHAGKTATTSATSGANNTRRKLQRRNSYDDVSDHQRPRSKSGDNEKLRRPSEQVMLILNDSTAKTTDDQSDKYLRRRKMSVCYSSSNNLSGITASTNINTSTNNSNNNNNSNNIRTSTRAGNGRRKGEKWSLPARLQPWQRLEQEEIIDPLVGKAASASAESSTKSISTATAKTVAGSRARKKSQPLKQTESGIVDSHNKTLNSSTEQNGSNLDYDERLCLEDDGLDNFLPNADLAYNEFMPEGPSGYLVETEQVTPTCSSTSGMENLPVNETVDQTNSVKKTRRLSSPNFFKSPFSKSSKSKSGSSSGKSVNTPHESTSWEWCRSKKSDAQRQENKLMYSRNSATGSLDSSSLSEINFPTSSTENSFRILEEAILSSGETLNVANGNLNGGSETAVGGNSLGSTSSSGSQRSSNNSTTTKKKSRSFNRILRKVF